MKDLNLTFYDWLGYLIPGSIVILSIYPVIQAYGLFSKLNISIENINDFVGGLIFFFLAYLMGHIIHSVSNLTLDKRPYGKYAPDEYFEKNLGEDFSEAQIKAIVDIIINKFNVNVGSDMEKELKNNYWLCYYDVVDNIENSLTQTFLNINGFYRGTLISTIMASLTLSMFSITNHIDREFIYLAIFLILISPLLYQRSKRFKIYLTRSVYFEFLSLNKKGEKKDDIQNSDSPKKSKKRSKS